MSDELAMVVVTVKSMKRKSIKFAYMTIQEAGRHLLEQLQQLYDRREASNIAELVMEQLTGLRKIDRMVKKDTALSNGQADKLNIYIKALQQHRPVQYVLGEAWFYGMKFFVNDQVLIPRPETEELVQWIIDENSDGLLRIFDVGTGSGCIPIALKKKLPGATVYSCDVSEGALNMARKNASALKADVDFFQMDILDPGTWASISLLNIIVSNPPYIPLNERSLMHANVIDYEPHLALFVEDNDPLIFYRTIAELGTKKLSSPGKVYVEVHEDLAKDVAEIFTKSNYHSVEIKKDMQGKERMIRGCFI
jgi:release factor glutamine methyltransferase